MAVSTQTQLSRQLLTRGVVVFDAHRTFWDILLTARYLAHTLQPTALLMPIAGYALYVPGMKQIVSAWARRYAITWLPVYRRIEYTPVNALMWGLCLFYPLSLTPARREQANHTYLRVVQNAKRQPGHVVLVAPYGSPLLFGGKVKYGARKLAQQTQIYASVTRWDTRSWQFETDILPARVHTLQAVYAKLGIS